MLNYSWGSIVLPTLARSVVLISRRFRIIFNYFSTQVQMMLIQPQVIIDFLDTTLFFSPCHIGTDCKKNWIGQKFWYWRDARINTRKIRFHMTRGRFHKFFCTLRPTFEKLFWGVERALRRAANFDRAISTICALRPTFMKSTPEQSSKTLPLPTGCSAWSPNTSPMGEPKPEFCLNFHYKSLGLR